MYKLEIVYKDENLPKEEIIFDYKEVAYFYYEEFKNDKDVLCCKLIKRSGKNAKNL